MKTIKVEEIKISARPNVVFEHYPFNPEFFKKDLAPYVNDIIKIHGYEEWKAAILTNEMHRHLGIYSILGVKMGVLAREILGLDMDDIRVKAYTGHFPPVSCMIDGLQVATGASLGRGAITIFDMKNSCPEAIFSNTYLQLQLTLKGEYQQLISETIKELSKQFSFNSTPYMNEIRKLSIKYWLEFNRYDIFEASQFVNTIKKVN